MTSWSGKKIFLIIIAALMMAAAFPAAEGILLRGTGSHTAMAAKKKSGSKVTYHIEDREGTIYIVSKKGKGARGWVLVGKNVYYAKKGGKAMVNRKFSGITFDETGKAKNSTSTKLMKKCLKILKNKNGASMSAKLRYAWSYMARFHYSSYYPNRGVSGWQRSTALRSLNSNSGNCYGYACSFAALAWAAGYKPYVVAGRVPGSRDGASDGYTRHCWVRINGGYYDPELYFANRIRFCFYGSGSFLSHEVQQTVSF